MATQIPKQRSGVITVAAAGQAVAGPAFPGDKAVLHTFHLTPDPANDGAVYVGNDGADGVDSTNGFPLSAGDTLPVECRGLDELRFDADNAGAKIRWILASTV